MNALDQILTNKFIQDNILKLYKNSTYIVKISAIIQVSKLERNSMENIIKYYVFIMVKKNDKTT